MTNRGKLLTLGVKGILRLICRVEGRPLQGVPTEGPLIIIVNHINFLEVPLISTHMLPREFRALTKKETWDNPFFRILADSWGGIPLDRENPGIETFRRSLESLKDNKILFIAPEGTRTEDGILREGHLGVTSLALKSGAPILPIAHFGGEHFWKNIKRMRRTRVTFNVGDQVIINSPVAINKRVKREITDQLMYQLAALMPENYRGHYRVERSFEHTYIAPVDP